MMMICALASAWCACIASAQEGAALPHWIWRPAGSASSEIPAEKCYFRTRFVANENSRLVLDATADNAFVLYLDGDEIAQGNDWHTAEHVERRLTAGPHVLAAIATNEGPGPAGFLVRGGVLPLGQGAAVHTDRSWKTALDAGKGDEWTRPGFNDSLWVSARDLGPLGTGPWSGVSLNRDTASRFRVPGGFRVATVAAPSVTGSVVAFTFDPDGVPCVSVEGGPIARLIDDDKDGRYDRREPIETQVRNCQGMLFLRDRLFVVGQGRQGAGIYCLSDPDSKGAYRNCELIRQSAGGMGEHGPHAIALGPDGRLYFGTGNHAHLKPPIDRASPVNIAYEGELLPHYNDPRGHAAGVMAPGGEILRSDDDGRTWKRIVAGFRNQYDFAFNREGELFTFDSDMEWDVALPWYRPVRINHCPKGAEFGWRNGSGKWPTYFVDSLPAVLDVGRGSPTGVAFYQAHQFPSDYDDSLLVCDWSMGRILAIHLEPRGSSYAARATELVTGQPLNCTDIEVGPDGAVYFTTGGRRTQGGLYRVSWNEAKPDRAIEKPTARDALHFSSPSASFTRRQVAAIRDANPESWAHTLEQTASNAGGRESARDRIRALELLCQQGPQPKDELLVALAGDADRAVRARATALLGERSSRLIRHALERALGDSDPVVRRHACEGFMEQPCETIPVAALIPLLAESDRGIRFAARVAVEHGDLGVLRKTIDEMSNPQPGLMVAAMLALVRGSRLDEKCQEDLLKGETALLERLARIEEGQPRDAPPPVARSLAARPEPRPLGIAETDSGTRSAAELRADLLRVIGLTFLLGPRRADAPAAARLRPILIDQLAHAGLTDSPASRETARLLAYLDEPRAVSLILRHQAGVSDQAAALHDAYCLRAIKKGWSADAKRRFWAWFETASRWEGGYSFQGYLDVMLQDLVKPLAPGEIAAYLAQGERWPFPARVLVRELDLGAKPQCISVLTDLFRRLDSGGPGAKSDLRAVIVEKLGRSAREDAHRALRELASADPASAEMIARAIAARPQEDDLPLLVEALDSRDLNTTSLVVSGLRRLKSVPSGAAPLARLLRTARRIGPVPGMTTALDRLAERWTGEKPARNGDGFAAALAAWEAVYRKRYPDAPPIGMAEPAVQKQYTLPMLVEKVLNAGVMKTASGPRGQKAIERAKCLDCHKFGSKGEGVGPDLTTVSSRFRPVEILESIVEPSKVISDQYKPVTVVTVDGKVYNGMPVISDGPNLVLLLSDGTKATIPKVEIEAQKESKTSVMPPGLINALDYQEIADLLALFSSAPKVEASGGGK
jgi:putative heme-binding domain-containing protein